MSLGVTWGVSSSLRTRSRKPSVLQRVLGRRMLCQTLNAEFAPIPELGDLNVIIQVEEWHSSDQVRWHRYGRGNRAIWDPKVALGVVRWRGAAWDGAY